MPQHARKSSRLTIIWETSTMCRTLLATALALVLSGMASAAPTFELLVAAGKHERVNVPVRVRLTLPGDSLNLAPMLKDADGKPVPAQLTHTSLTMPEAAPVGANVDFRELNFILTNLKAGETRKY